MTIKTPWTYDDYIQYIEQPEGKNEFLFSGRFIHRGRLCLEPDLIGNTKLYFEKPRLLKCNYTAFEDDNGRLYNDDEIFDYMYDHVYKAICFGKTFHCYAVPNTRTSGFTDKTEEIWNFVNHHEIDYMNMTNDDYTLIKLYHGTLTGY